MISVNTMNRLVKKRMSMYRLPDYNVFFLQHR